MQQAEGVGPVERSCQHWLKEHARLGIFVVLCKYDAYDRQT